MPSQTEPQSGTKKAIIYIRVSDEQQVDGTSLEFQDEECRRYCLKNGFEVIEVFREEGESAKDLSLNNRKEFLRAIEFCRKNKGKIHAFVVLRVNRFARNTEDHFAVRKILHTYGVALLSVTEPIGNKPAEKLVETVLAATSDYENAIRRQQCTDGMSQKINQGLWPWKLPVGYRCGHFKKRGEKKTAPEEPDEQIFLIVQRALREYASGILTSQAELLRQLEAWGLSRLRGRRTTPQLVDKILGDYLKLYAGILLNPFTGEEKAGLHPPMITQDEYRRIVMRRSGKTGKIRHDRYNPSFPLRRTVVCARCKRPLTGSSSVGNGGRYAYYHCYSKDCRLAWKGVAKDRLEKAFSEYLVAISPKQEYLVAFKETILDLWQEKAKTAEQLAKKYETALTTVEEKRRRIFEMREDGSYSKEEFRERKEQIEYEITAIKTAMEESRTEKFDIAATLTFATDFIGTLPRSWFNTPPADRPQFQRLLFPDGIPYARESGFGTARLGLLFELNQEYRAHNSSLVHFVGNSWNRILEHLHEWEKLRSPVPPLLGELVLD